MSRSYPGSLHNHTQYSNLRLRDCIIKENNLIDYAIELGHEVLAITDHEAICAYIKAWKYYQKKKKDHPNFKLILGNEIYLCRNGLNKQNFVSGQDDYYHFVLLAKDAIGNKQIRELSTRAWRRTYVARRMRQVPTYYQDLFDVIGANPGHVIGTTACLGGALPTQIIKYSMNHSEDLWSRIETWTTQMNGLFGQGNFYLELQPSESAEQIYVNRKLIELSNKLSIPYIITTDSHYLKKSDALIHEAFLKSQDNNRRVDLFYKTAYMMDTAELESLLSLTEDELATAYDNIRHIKDMCEDYNLLKPLEIPQLPWKSFFPTNKYRDEMRVAIPYLKTFEESDFIGDRVLADAIVEKAESNSKLRCKEIYDAINDCLEKTWLSSIKNKTHWSSYYLNLQKIIDCCWDAGSLVGPGRGSGVGFILLYLCDITQINPLWESTPTFSWRFLNPDRVSVLDVDVDIEGGRRKVVLNKLREVYGDDRVSNVATFGTEKSKAAILTAARGLGIDVDIASYLSAMIPSDRGITRTLDQCYYGDPEAGFEPIKQFVNEMTNNYPELWNVARNIEGLVDRLGQHAGGVIFVDKPFTESTALMRAPDGTIITAYDLHDCEDVSLIKYDLLSVEAMDKMHTCLDLLCEYGLVDKKPTLKEIYESTIGIYNLERDDPKMWEMVWNHKIMSLFQMEKQSGVQGIALVHPSSIDDLAVLNSVIRLMAQEKGAEQPLNKFARFKANVNEWYKEMDAYGLTDEEVKILEPILLSSYGMCESQEKFMQLVQLPACGGFDLTWADRLRKSIAKKNPAAYEQLTKEYFENMEAKHLSKNLCTYVWNVLVATSRGYGFNASHTLAYSLIGLQEMNLAFKYPSIIWDCACLITDSIGVNAEDEENSDEEEVEEPTEVYTCDLEEFTDEDEEDEEEGSYEEEDEEGFPAEIVITKDKKKKKKTKSTNYGKIATAIGKIKAENVLVSPPSLNESKLTFFPDLQSNTILYGLTGISQIGEDLVKDIIAHRPYASLDDFLSKVKIKKPQMINLIKSGACDCFGDRIEVMKQYVASISDQKKRVTLQNMKMLIDFKLLPPELDFQCRVFNFNKYLKKAKVDNYYGLDSIAIKFYETNFDMDLLEASSDEQYEFLIPQTKWDNIYQTHMDIVRPYIKKHSIELLKQMNDRLLGDVWNKYCIGSISKWEMDSLSYYHHDHELMYVDPQRYGWADFSSLPEDPLIDRIVAIQGRQIPLFKLNRIAGTVLDKDKSKKTVTLLTTSGVVVVKIYGAVFSNYDKQISERGADGKKHVLEKSWFSRGNKIVVTGIRRDDGFFAKKYSKTPYHLVELITDIYDDGTIATRGERYGEGVEEE